ncbi:Hsp70 protein-domain-containing protein [Flagelloscypha sp. PMI_526]|nr:Hsp70 protein-domain-containing protein [Flagelloscypha sp. PMI_526]
MEKVTELKSIGDLRGKNVVLLFGKTRAGKSTELVRRPVYSAIPPFEAKHDICANSNGPSRNLRMEESKSEFSPAGSWGTGEGTCSFSPQVTSYFTTLSDKLSNISTPFRSSAPSKRSISLPPPTLLTAREDDPWLARRDGFAYHWSKFRRSQVVNEFIPRSKTLLVILAGLHNQEWLHCFIQEFMGQQKKDLYFTPSATRRLYTATVPEELSSLVLTTTKETTESYRCGTVLDAAITVPACFNDSQRQAPKDGGTIVGLATLRVVNEPAADRNMVIFDLGGGSSDASLWTIEEGIFEEFKRKYNKVPFIICVLLASMPSALSLPLLKLPLKSTLSLRRFQPVENVLCSSKIGKSNVYRIVLQKPDQFINPDEATAHGATIQAVILFGDTSCSMCPSFPW